MAVRINDISGNVEQTYLATHVNQCHNTTDKEVFKLVEETGEVITMGKVIGEPVKVVRPTGPADSCVPVKSKLQQEYRQSQLLDAVDHLNKAAEIANSLVPDYEGYESYTTDEDGDETETIVWEKAQVMIDKLQHVGGFNEDADELEDAQREIDEETQS